MLHNVNLSESFMSRKPQLKRTAPHKFLLLALGYFLILTQTTGAVSSKMPELKGILTLGGESRFSLQLPGEDRAFWAKVGEARHGLQVIAYDSRNETLEVQYHGKRGELTLVKADAAPLPVLVSRPLTDGEKAKRRKALEKRPAIRRASHTRPSRRKSSTSADSSRARPAPTEAGMQGADQNNRSRLDVAAFAQNRGRPQQAGLEEPVPERHTRRLPRRKKTGGQTP